MRKVTHARFESIGPPLPIQADGDLLGATPLHVAVRPSALLAFGVNHAHRVD
jgi:diacylglycerol kinase family enzyme